MFLEFVAPVLIVIGLIWGFFVWRRISRERKSLAASRGDEMAMSLERERVKARRLRILGVILAPVAFGAALYLGAGGQLSVTVAFVCAGACFVWAAVVTGRYNANFKENIVKAELSKVFDNLRYEPNGTLSAASIRGLGFFTHDDVIKGNDLIEAEYKGIRFSQCDLNVQEMYTVEVYDKDDDETRTETRYNEVFRGRAMLFGFAEKCGGPVQVIKRNFDEAKATSSRADWQLVETELSEFNEHFEVFARDPLDAMTVLTPQMIEGIFHLHKTLDVPMAFYFAENTMTAFIAMNRDAFDVSVKRTLLEERKALRNDIELVTKFMDTMYFKRQEDGALPEEGNNP